MVITRTPYRVSFLGGGTDYRPYFMKYGGSVISTTIDKYCYLFIRELPDFFEHNTIVKYSVVETVKDLDEICHPSVRECLKYMNLKNMSIAHDGDLPARAGLASSSAFTVGLLNGLHTIKGESLDGLELAKEAIHVEQDLIGENVGVQDQIAVAVGGLNRIYFERDGYKVKPLNISNDRKQKFQNNLMLFFTGQVRFASDIAKSQLDNTPNKLKELHKMCSLVDEGERILTDRNANLAEFGKLLDYSWQLKRSLTDKISNQNIDNIYKRAKAAGAIGGKILGAGGGGFILFYVEPDKRSAVKLALKDLLEVPFAFEDDGSKIIYNADEGVKICKRTVNF